MPRQRTLLSLFMFSHFAHHVATGGLAPLLPFLRDAFALDYFRSGLLISSYSLSLGFGQLPLSALADRVRRHRLVAVGLLGVGGAGLAIGVSGSFGQLVLLLVIMGIMAATYHAPTTAFLSGALPVEQRGRTLGTHIIGGSLAFLAAPVLAVGIASLTGSWRLAFVLMALPALMAGVGVLWFARPWEAARAARWALGSRQRRAIGQRVNGAMARLLGRRGAAIKAALDAPRTRLAGQQRAWPLGDDGAVAALLRMGPLVLVTLVSQLLSATLFAYLPLYLVDRHELSRELAGMAVGLVAGTGVIFAPLGGALSDRIGRAPVLVLSVVALGPITVAFTVVPFGLALLALLVAFGFAMTAKMPVLESLFADAIAPERRATVLGLYYFFSQESAAVATPLLGRLIDATTPTTAFFWLGVLGSALSLALLVTRQRLLAPAPSTPALHPRVAPPAAG